MSRARAFLLLHVGIGLAILGSLVGASAAGAQASPATPPPVATLAPDSSVPATEATAAPATSVESTLPAGTRGGADEGGVVKPSHETWDAQRIVTTTVLVVVALAAIGYVFGKVRSSPPKHPDLDPQPEDLEITS